jgi:putative endonuclease
MLNQSRIVYVLRSVNNPDRYYTGLTDNVDRRLAVHNSGGSKHTAHLRPWSFVASTTFANAESVPRSSNISRRAQDAPLRKDISFEGIAVRTAQIVVRTKADRP